jgi:NAD-dependent dihydropyrimidine dehydrogenase PreA subunit
MALFIDVEVAPEVAQNTELARKLVEVCPVNIFALGPQERLEIVEKNLDECTLCELCLAVAPPGTLRVRKLYGEHEVLERKA